MYNFQFVIVLYKTNILESATFISLLKDLKNISILIYDNSPSAQSVDGILDTSWNIVYYHDEFNSGLSTAYNMGAKIGRDNGKNYLILLDQDTNFESQIVGKYVDSIMKFSDIDLFVPILKMNNGLVMSPCIYKNKRGKAILSISCGIQNLDEYAPVNSGLCVKIDTFIKVGGYNEKVALDGADFQFIDRYKRFDNKFVIINAICYQEFSAFDKDLERVLRRFSIYKKDVKNYEVYHWTDRFYHERNLVFRMLYLTWQHRTLGFLREYIKK